MKDVDVDFISLVPKELINKNIDYKADEEPENLNNEDIEEVTGFNVQSLFH